MTTTLKDSTLPLARTARAERIKLAIVIAAAVVMGILVVGHVGWTNGPWYWKWPWRRLSVWPLYALVALAAAPFFIGQWLYARRGWKASRVLPLLMLTTFSLMLVMSFCQPHGLRRIAAIIENTSITSYYYAASRLEGAAQQGIATADWLAVYPQFMAQFPVHGGFKPPGLILYFLAFIQLFGDGFVAQTMSGLVIGLLGTCTVPATYLLVRSLADDEPAALASASYMALCPSLLMFFPMFDQVYPAIGCVMIWLWWRALRTGRLKFGLAFGALLFVGTMMSHMVLVLGALLAAMTMFHIATRRTGGLVTALAQGTVAVSVTVLLYVILNAATGFDPIETFLSINSRLDTVLVPIRRPWPVHMAFDVYDFALGTAWISFVLVAMYVVRARPTLLRWPLHDAGTRLAFLALLQIVVFAGGAFLPGEAARLWQILMPLLMAPLGLELSRWTYRARVTVYGCALLLATLVCQNIILINIGENLTGKQIGVPDEKGHVAHE